MKRASDLSGYSSVWLESRASPIGEDAENGQETPISYAYRRALSRGLVGVRILDLSVGDRKTSVVLA